MRCLGQPAICLNHAIELGDGYHSMLNYDCASCVAAKRKIID